MDVTNPKLNSEYLSRMKKYAQATSVMFSATNVTNSQRYEEQLADGMTSAESFYVQRNKEIKENMGFEIRDPAALRGPNEFTILQFEEYHPLKNSVYSSFLPEHLTEIFKQKSIQALENQTQEYNIIMRNSLAGKIESEVEIEQGDNFTKMDLEELKYHFMHHLENILGMKVVDMRFDSLWTNFQKPKEYNPIHSHSGLFSFVWYLDIPEVIRHEWKDSITSSPSDGMIQFHSEESGRLLTFNPRTADLFIFNAYQQHQVVPFQSDVTRISLAGNISIVVFEDGSEYMSKETSDWAHSMLGKTPDRGETINLIKELEL